MVKQTQQKHGIKEKTHHRCTHKKVDIILAEAHLFSDKPTTFEENSVILNCIKNRGLQKVTRTLIFRKSESSK